MTQELRGIALKTDVKAREFDSGREHCLSREQVSGEESAPEITVAIEKRADSLRHTWYILLVARVKLLDY